MSHQQYSYRPNMARNVTRKWAEARQVNYGGDDWGEDPYNSYEEPVQQPLSYDRRAQTNPPAFNSHQRMSFDQNDEQRNLHTASDSSSSAGFPAFNNAQPAAGRFYGGQPAYPPPSRQQTMPVQGIHPNRDLNPSMPVAVSSVLRDSTRPDSRDSNPASRSFPPRKSSLGQSDLPSHTESSAISNTVPTGDTSKPLPFLRPADIYARMEEEKEKERRSQDSSRPSMDSLQRDAHSGATKALQSTAADTDASRRRQPTLDTVAERKSEYGLENMIDAAALKGVTPSSVRPINTSVPQQSSYPSASSKYTDRVDPVSATTEESRSPARNTAQPARNAGITPTSIPLRDRGSTFESEGAPTVPPKDSRLGIFNNSTTLQHQPSSGYRTIVKDAFDAENQKGISPTVSQESMLRSNTTSTSEISPIVERMREQPWKQAPKQTPITEEQIGESFSAPRRMGTNRQDSPSPARQPLSMVSADIPEPHSALPMEDSLNTPITKDTATQAQITRPGPAILVHQQPRSKEYIHNQDPSMSTQMGLSSVRKQGSQASSDQRSASDEWQEWSAARREFNAKLGIKDSNPTTPGPELTDTSSDPLAMEASGNTSRTTRQTQPQDIDMPIIPTTTNLHPTSRPDMSRDESFRPVLPGGWQSSESVPQVRDSLASAISPSSNVPRATGPAASVFSPARPHALNETNRTESLESIPTATAPRQENWRSEPRAQAFANARNAGSALAGIFPASHTTSAADDSEVSSINEHDEGQTGRHKEAASAARDFAASHPNTSTTAPKQSSAYNFDKAAVDVAETPTNTVRGRPVEDKPSSFDAPTGLAHVSGLPGRHPHTGRDESPSKESVDEWWEDDEDEPSANTDVPAPLRTPQRNTRTGEERDVTHPSFAHGGSAGDVNHNQLEKDIVKSLTPKSSSIHPPVVFDPQTQAHNTRGFDETGSRSPPFAAAALAISPSRGSQSLEEQSTFKPLQAPQQDSSLDKSNQLPRDEEVNLPRNIIGEPGSTNANQPEQPEVRTSSHPHTGHSGGIAKSIIAAEATRAAGDDMGHQHEHEDQPHGHHQAAAPVIPRSKPLSPEPISTHQPQGSTSARQKPESPALARLNSSAKKEFTIMSDEPFTPSPITQTKVAHGESSWPGTSPNTDSQITRASPVETVAKSYPARATANAAVTLPSPTNKGSDLAPVHEDAIEHALNEAEPTATEVQPEADESRSVKTTATTVRPSHESPRPGTVASESTAQPSTPPSRLAAPVSSSTSTGVTPQITKANVLAHPYDPNAAFPFDKVPVSQIVGMQNAQQRINAYNENRDVYIQPVGHLESWLSSMNTPEHAEIFSGQQPVTGQNPTPSPRASTGRGSAGTSGTRQMQEDGRRLLEGAKKYGGKASVLGKGIFSKGKEKLRTVSASNKGSRKAPSITETTQPSSTSTSVFASAPQLPTPSQTTPIDEEMVSQYFASQQGNQGAGLFGARATERSAMQPPFTPISEVSTRETSNLETPYRPESGISLDQTPRAQQAGKSTDTGDKRKSAAAISAIGSERESGRFATDMLNPTGDEDRRNSSVSDVSSVSDTHVRRQSIAARTVSPPIEHQTMRNIPPYSAMTIPTRPDAPSPISTTKQVEAAEDRVEESTLPRYSSTAGKVPKIASGTHVLPVAQLGDKPGATDEQKRPFSFVGNDSLLHTGEQRQHTIDSPDATLRSTVRHSNATPATASQPPKAPAIVSTPATVDRVQSESPLPSARRPPEELARLRQNAAPYVPQQDEGAYRIPGPYTRELRSPKPKTHSPVKEQSQVDYPRESSPSLAIDAPATTANTPAFGSAEIDKPNTAYGSNMESQTQHEPQHQQLYLQQQLDSATPLANVGKDRNRKGSRLGGLFGTRTKSPTRRQDDRPRLELDNRRNSLFKIGSRNSMSSRGNESEQNDEGPGQKPRPVTGPRRISKDLFKTTTFGQQQIGQANYGHGSTSSQMEPLSAPPTKKKRFSALFGRSSRDLSQIQAPTRASTLPLPMDPSQAQSQDFHGQYPEDQQGYSTTGPVQPFQGRQPPGEIYYGQPNEDQRQMHIHNTHDQLTGHVPQQQEYNNRQSFGHRQFYDPGSNQQQHSSHPHATSISGMQDSTQVSRPNVPHGQGLDRFEPQQQGVYYQHHPEQRPGLRLDTGDRQAGFVPASAPPVPQDYLRSRQRDTSQATPLTAIPGHQHTEPKIPQTRANRDISYGSEFRGAPATQSPGSSSNITPRVQALHMRSRSPKLGRPTSEDVTDEFNGLAPSPANDLGTFSNKKVSPAGGIPRSPEEQEKPWTIGLPGEDGRVGTDHAHAMNNSRAREIRRIMLERAGVANGSNGVSNDLTSDTNRPRTVAERFMGHSMPPPKGQVRAVQTPTSTSTSTAAGKVPSPKASLTNVSINRNPSLRGKGPTLSRSGTPVPSNADLARTMNEQGSSTSHDASNAAKVPPVPSPRTAHLSESHTGERNEHYPANAIAALASQNRINVGKKQEPLSTSTWPNEPVGAIVDRSNVTGDRELQKSPVVARGQENRNANRDLPIQETSKHESAYEARNSLANAPTPPPPEPKTVRRPPETSRNIEIHELSGSRPEGYESDDEPMMSATAWPGQEWQPVFDMSED